LQHEADPFLKKAMNQHFGPGGKWHFYYVDKRNRPIVNKISKVIYKLEKYVSPTSPSWKQRRYDTHNRAMSMMSDVEVGGKSNNI
jgi:hypothetical protein